MYVSKLNCIETIVKNRRSLIYFAFPENWVSLDSRHSWPRFFGFIGDPLDWRMGIFQCHDLFIFAGDRAKNVLNRDLSVTKVNGMDPDVTPAC